MISPAKCQKPCSYEERPLPLLHTQERSVSQANSVKGSVGGGKERKKLTSACVTVEENWFLLVHCRDDFYGSGKVCAVKHLAMHVCVPVCPLCTLKEWTHGVPSCPHARIGKFWMMHLLWGKQKANKQSFSSSKFNLLTFVLMLNQLVCHVFNANIS